MADARRLPRHGAPGKSYTSVVVTVAYRCWLTHGAPNSRAAPIGDTAEISAADVSPATLISVQIQLPGGLASVHSAFTNPVDQALYY